MLDPMPESEVTFAQSLLPETGFTRHRAGPGCLGTVTRTARHRRCHSLPAPNRSRRRSWPRARTLKIVQKYGGRPDRLDLDAARDAGVAVAVMPLRGCIAVAELAMTLILALSKQLIEAHRATATGAYRDLGLEPAQSSQRVFAFQWMKLPHLQEVRGKTLGLIGFGEIGTEVAKTRPRLRDERHLLQARATAGGDRGDARRPRRAARRPPAILGLRFPACSPRPGDRPPHRRPGTGADETDRLDHQYLPRPGDRRRGSHRGAARWHDRLGRSRRLHARAAAVRQSRSPSSTT